jgi:hypothetical protein
VLPGGRRELEALELLDHRCEPFDGPSPGPRRRRAASAGGSA